MAKGTQEDFAVRRRPGGRHLAPEEPKGPEKQAPRRKKRSEEQQAEKTATAPGKRREAVRRGDLPPVRLPAKPGLARTRTADAAQVDAETFYRHFVPYIEEAHQRNERSLKAGVWLRVQNRVSDLLDHRDVRHCHGPDLHGLCGP